MIIRKKDNTMILMIIMSKNELLYCSKEPQNDMSNFTVQQFQHFYYFYRQYDRLLVHSKFCKHSGDACHVGGVTTVKEEQEYEILPWVFFCSTVMIVLLYMHACTLTVNRP